MALGTVPSAAVTVGGSTRFPQFRRAGVRQGGDQQSAVFKKLRFQMIVNKQRQPIARVLIVCLLRWTTLSCSRDSSREVGHYPPKRVRKPHFGARSEIPARRRLLKSLHH
jgi:hypothetical protein